MEIILIYISMAFLLIYTLVALFVFMGFYIPVIKKNEDKEIKLISVIIPFRNEEKNLAELIESLRKLNYSTEHFEIIFINDYSTDKSCEIVNSSGLKNFTLIHSTGEGKKAAISFGIEHAKYPIIASTDADCKVPPLWLDEINKAGSNAMILGPVQLEPVSNLLEHIQEIEFAALQSVSASMVNWKMPMMSNGANLAYQKNEFNERSLKKETASGDDVFLLEDFKNRKLPICFLWNVNSIVKTKPANSLKELVQQKVRWASKSKYYKNKMITGLGILIAIINLLVLCNCANILVFNITSGLSVSFLVTKIIMDIIFILPYMILIKKPYLVFIMPAFVIIYPFYFIYVLILSIRGKFTWKDRTYHA